MDAKMQEYEEKIKGGFQYQSSGVRGAFAGNFKTTNQGSSGGGYSNSMSKQDNNMSLLQISPEIRSNPSRVTSHRTPQVNLVKMDKLNNRLMINDDRILGLISMDR